MNGKLFFSVIAVLLIIASSTGSTGQAGAIAIEAAYSAASTGTTERVSVASDGTEGNSDSEWPSISADGQYVAFLSDASNLVSGDTNGHYDIFVHDLVTGETSRVSVASDGTEGNGNSYWPSISADGRYVAFESLANNLVNGDTNSWLDIFVHDRLTGETSRVSVASDGTEGNGHSSWSSISADGHYVAFFSYASNLVSGDTNGQTDVFVHDLVTGETSRVSVASDGTEGNNDSSLPSISIDGRYVAFGSVADNLISGDSNNYSDVFVHDRVTGETSRVSVASNGTEENNWSYWPSISVDGRYVAFGSWASNLVNGDTNGYADIFVHDLVTGETSRVSVASDGTEGNNNSDWLSSISADERYVAFESYASNLVSGDTNGTWDIFVHDLVTGETSRVSVASNGTEGNYRSELPSISADGCYVAFKSGASNLVSGDTNGAWDIFVHDRQGRPSSFLNLPISYSNFSQSAQGNVGGVGPGRVNSWFDHTYPNYGINQNITTWSGAYYTGAAKTYRKTCDTGLSCYDGHSGIDFQRLTPGEQVFPAATGTVFGVVSTCQVGYPNCGDSYGNQVWINHGNGFATLYGHLDSVFVSNGASITALSQPLGTIGTTGNSSGPHLHFGVYYDQNGNGQWSDNEVVDPYGWFGTGTDPWGTPSIYLWKYPIWVSQIVGTTGSTLTSPSGNAVATIPPGAVPSPLTIELWDAPPTAEPSAQLRSIGSFWLKVLEWFGTSSVNGAATPASPGFSQPVTVTIGYDDSQMLHLDTSQLGIYRWDAASTSWVLLPTTIETIQHIASAQTTEAGSFDLQAPALCPTDVQEPNDNYDAATQVIPNGQGTTSLFDITQDIDWFRFEATKGNKYIFETGNLATGVDTVIELYDQDGVTVLGSDDNGAGGKASHLEWIAPLSGTYFLRVSQPEGSSFGCNSSYEIRLNEFHLIYLPLIVK